MTESWRSVLCEQVFSDVGPGTVLRDFETLLNFIGDSGVRSTGKYHLLPMAGLATLDEQMAAPVRPRLERPQQFAFPQIHGLYLLLRALRLVKPEGSGKTTGRLVLDAPRVAQWRELNPTEKYFTLLDALIHKVDQAAAGDPSRGPGMLMELYVITLNSPREGRNVDSIGDLERWIVRCARNHFIPALVELFGWIEVTRRPQQDRESWTASRVRRTAFGHAMLCATKATLSRSAVDSESPMDKVDFLDVLVTGTFTSPIGGNLASIDEAVAPEESNDDQVIVDSHEDRHRELDDDDEGEQYGEEQALPCRLLFAEHFPAWQRSLKDSVREFQEGLYTFKVSLDDVWRSIEVPAETTCDSLLFTILKAFRFRDEDHLYEFTLTDIDGSTLNLIHDRMELTDTNQIDAAEMSVGELPLAEKGTMKLLYDFGDCWQFKIKLERIDPAARRRACKIIERHGTPPRQYEC